MKKIKHFLFNLLDKAKKLVYNDVAKQNAHYKKGRKAMNLGEFVKQYREKNNLSQRKFALRCGLSNGYISMLEDGKNPSTGKPLVPKIENVMKIASAMGYELGTLFEMVDDMEIDVSAFIQPQRKSNVPDENTLTEDEGLLIDLFRQVPADLQQNILEQLRLFAKLQK